MSEPMSSMCSALQPGGVGGAGEHGLGQVGTADRLAVRPARGDLAFVQLQAELAQRGGHAQRALLAVGEELGEPLGEQRAGVVDGVAEDVQFAADRRAVVDRGDLDRGDDAHAVALAGAQRLGDAADRVVVGERQQLHAGLGRALHDLGGRQGAVGVGGVGLQVEAGRQPPERMQSLQEFAWSAREGVAGDGEELGRRGGRRHRAGSARPRGSCGPCWTGLGRR